MVKTQAFISFNSTDDIALFLASNPKYTHHCITAKNERTIDVIFYNYALAETSLDNYGERYVIKWLSQDEAKIYMEE